MAWTYDVHSTVTSLTYLLMLSTFERLICTTVKSAPNRKDVWPVKDRRNSGKKKLTKA